MTFPADRATLARYRAFGLDALSRARDILAGGAYFKGGPSRHRTKRGRWALRMALKDARWAYTACARVVLVNREPIAAADREAARRMAHSDNHDRQRAAVG